MDVEGVVTNIVVVSAITSVAFVISSAGVRSSLGMNGTPGWVLFESSRVCTVVAFMLSISTILSVVVVALLPVVDVKVELSCPVTPYKHVTTVKVEQNK